MKRRLCAKTIVVYVVGTIALLSLLLSLYLFLYAFERIYTEQAEQERLLEEWESLLSPLAVEQEDRLDVEQMIVSRALHVSTNASVNMDMPATTVNVIGKLEIPKLKAKWPVIAGVGNKELAKGVGHYIGSAAAGQLGNSIYAGHREMGLKKVGGLAIGEEIIVETLDGTFTYEVTATRIVPQEDRSVSIESDESLLTLITCYPFDYFGSAPNRYIVTATLSP